MQLPRLQRLAQQRVGVGVFCQQDDAEGIPVQAADGMHGAGLPGGAVIPGQVIGQRPGVAVEAGVHQEPGGLVQCDDGFVLIEDLQRARLRRIVRRRLDDGHADLITGADHKICPLGDAIDIKALEPFCLMDKRGGAAQLPLQK